MGRIPPLLIVGLWGASILLVTQYTIRAYKDSAEG